LHTLARSAAAKQKVIDVAHLYLLCFFLQAEEGFHGLGLRGLGGPIRVSFAAVAALRTRQVRDVGVALLDGGERHELLRETLSAVEGREGNARIPLLLVPHARPENRAVARQIGDDDLLHVEAEAEEAEPVQVRLSAVRRSRALLRLQERRLADDLVVDYDVLLQVV